MSIKWFCDVCQLEIVAPENPVRVKAYRCGKNRDDAEVGWGESYDIGSAWCHKACADDLERAVAATFADAMKSK